MGGGVGVGAHGSVRVVTDTTKMGMPEVGIGFVPDVGGTYLLSRAPGRLGLHAALTGAPFSGADAIAMGFADHFVPHDELERLHQRRRRRRHRRGPGRLRRRAARESPFWRNGIGSTSATRARPSSTSSPRCAAHDAGPASDAADPIAGRSPIALAVTLEAVRRAADLDTLEDVLRQEFRTSCARAAVPRPGGGHPRPARRQGPQPEVVAGDSGTVFTGGRRGVLRAGRPRPDVPREREGVEQ